MDETPPQPGGRGESPNPDALAETYPGQTAVLERRAIARGWLKKPDGTFGLDEEKMARLVDKNYVAAMKAEEPRDIAACSRVVVTAVAQVMEQEKRDAGGETINHTVRAAGPPTIEEAVRAMRELEVWDREHRLALTAGPPVAGGPEVLPVVPPLRDDQVPAPDGQ